MRKLLSVFLAGCLLLLLPATIWASAETTYESEQGQAMIKLRLHLYLAAEIPLIQPLILTVLILIIQKHRRYRFFRN